jgi:mono/diheme cytochrome c family protein
VLRVLQSPRLDTWWLAAAILVSCSVAVAAPPSTADKPAKADPNIAYRGQIVPFLTKHCADCHGADAQEGDVRFDQFKDASAVAADVKTWQRVIEMLRSGAMPPEDVEQPSDAERRKVVHWIEQTIYNFDCDDVADPGRVTIRRLNRAEYNNTVRDLLGVTFRPADDFPSDDVGGGFDNIGDVLTLPPLLMEKYLAAAERIAEDAIVTDRSQFIKTQRRDRSLLRGANGAQYDNDRRAWYLTTKDGSVSTAFEFPRTGEYSLRVETRSRNVGDEPARMELRIDGELLEQFELSEERPRCEIMTKVSGGEHRLSVHFLNPFSDPAAEDELRRERRISVGGLEVDGPLDVRQSDYPAIHRQLVPSQPGEGRTVLQAAQANLKPLLSRAFRRSATNDEVNRFASLVDKSVALGDSFEQAMQAALTGVLVSPHFLFRLEGDPTSNESNSIRDLNDYELATRLSYFLWSSMPDDELFQRAASGKLRDESILQQQIRRMLADPKCESLVQNFFAQWLNLRLLGDSAPDPRVFPQFDAELKTAMRRETELFAAAIVGEDRSILDFISGRFTFVNARLARHYGLEGVYGDEFRRTEFTDQRHSGVLTQASILTLTSNPGRTSPVKRGKWVLENLLASPPPDPPADVPDLESVQKAKPNATLRQQLEIHRENPVCASCHKVMDALGFGLENFDAIGQWREQDGKFKIDASGELPGGAKFNGPLSLAKVLDKRRSEFARCLSEKLLTFALGRELQVQDRCAVDKIVEEIEGQDYRFSALVVAIAKSDPFRKRRGEGVEP